MTIGQGLRGRKQNNTKEEKATNHQDNGSDVQPLHQSG
jgi:hypothetical protein